VEEVNKSFALEKIEARNESECGITPSMGEGIHYVSNDLSKEHRHVVQMICFEATKKLQREDQSMIGEREMVAIDLDYKFEGLSLNGQLFKY
jgi:hypothetical protein